MNYSKKIKQMSSVWFFCILITISYFLILIYLYKNQLNRQNDTTAHIESVLSGKGSYSLMSYILAFLWKLPQNGFLIAFCLTIFSILSIFFTYILLKNHIQNIKKEHIFLAALVCNIYMPIYIPSLSKSPYLGMFGFNLWHNPTYIAMKPFALLSTIFFFKLINNYNKKSISITKLMYFSGSLFVTSLFKPSFAFAFIPCMVIFMIIDFIKGKGENILNYIIFGTTIFPTICLMLWQKTQLFDQQSDIRFGFFKVWRLYSNNPLISVILSLLFPLIILIFCYKDLLVDKTYRFGWLCAIINISIFAFLYESGARFAHGNLGWGANFAAGLIFIISMFKFLDKIKNMSKIKLIIISAILGVHVFCGINYIIRFLCTNKYL